MSIRAMDRTAFDGDDAQRVDASAFGNIVERHHCRCCNRCVGRDRGLQRCRAGAERRRGPAGQDGGSARGRCAAREWFTRRRRHHQQHSSRGLRRVQGLRAVPQRDLRRVVSVADAPDDAIARRRADSRPVRRSGVPFQERPRALRERGRRALHSRRVGDGGHARLSHHQGDWRPLPRGLRGRRGARRRERERHPRGRAQRRADSARLVRVPAAFVSSQRIFGDGGRAAGVARGRRLESDLRLLPQHESIFRQHLGRALRTGRAGLPGRGRRSLAAAGAAVLVRDHRRGGAGARARGRARRAGGRACLAARRPESRRGARCWARACTPCDAT